MKQELANITVLWVEAEAIVLELSQATSAVLAVDPPMVQGAQLGSWLFEQLAFLQAGGPVVLLLALLSVIALSILLVKLIQFQRVGLWQGKVASRALSLWQAGDKDQALALVHSNVNPIAQALARAMRGQRRGLAEARIREELLRYGTDVLFQLRLGLRPLEVISALAPLLGLLGTVLGMISAFQQLESAGHQVNPAVLSGGIWQALLTTAVGLGVAMPVVVALNWLERKVDHLAHDMDNLITQFFSVDLSAQLRAAEPQVAPQTMAINAMNVAAKSVRNVRSL